MCHLILVLPLAALPLLWLLPLGVSLPLYAGAVAVAGWAYWMTLEAMRLRVTTGAEALLHAVGTVLSVEGRRASIQLGGELWFTSPSSDALAVGDRVEVTGLDGLSLKVRKLDDGPAVTPGRGPAGGATLGRPSQPEG